MINDRCVYFHRLETGRIFYVGIGSIKRAYSRSNRNRHWHAIVEAHGRFYVTIFSRDLSPYQAGEIEKIWIEHLGIDRLANISRGGQASAFGYRHTDETKARISRNTAANRPDVVAKKRAASLGSNNPMYGRTHGAAAREKIASAKRGKPLSEATRAKMSIAHIARNRGLKNGH